jgi:MFS family permease
MGTRAREASGWSRSALAVVLFHSAAIQIVTFSLRPTVSYAALEAGLDPAWLGVFSAAFALPGLALAVPTGRIADRVGERTIAVVGAAMVLAACATALLGSSSIPALLVAVALFGCGQLVSVVADQAVLANRTTGSARDSVFGAYAFSISLGQGVGGAVLALGGDATTPDVFLQLAISAGLGLLTAISAVLIRSTARAGAAASESPAGLAMLREPGIARALAASCTVIASVEILTVYLPALGVARGLPTALVAALLVVRSLAAMASRLGLGWQIRAVGRRRLMVGGIAASAVAMAALALPVPAWALLVICIVFGFTNGVCQPLTLSWLSEIAPLGRRATVMSLRIAGNRVAQSALPLGVGMLAGVAGAGAVLVAMGGLVGVASWLSTAIGEPGRAVPDAPEEAA